MNRLALSYWISIIYGLGLALLPFGAMYRPSFGGYLTASPGIPLLLFAVILSFLTLGRKANPDTSKTEIRTARQSLRLWMLGLLLSALAVPIVGFSALFMNKALSLLVLTLIWLSPVICAPFLRERHLFFSVRTGFIVCVFAFFLSDLFNIIPITLRTTIFSAEYLTSPDSRPRGFMQEASHFSALISFYAFFIFAHIERNRSYSIIRLICFMALLSWVLLGLGSKGAIGGLVIAMMTIGFRWRQLPYLLLITPLVWILAATQFTALTLDYAEFSSVATRLGLALTTIMALAVNPLGYGYYGFYGAVQNFGTKAIDNLSQIFTLNLLELHSIVTDLVAVSTKSTLLDFLLTFGVFFIIFAWKLICRIDLMDPRARVFLVYIFIISMTTSGHASIPFFLGLVGLNRYFPRKCINFKY